MIGKAVFGRIKAFLATAGGRDDGGRRLDEERLRLATAALLVEAAEMDAQFDATERDAILGLLADRFDLTPSEVAALVDAAAAAVKSNLLFGFTQTIKDRFGHDERLALMEMLWEVAYADGELHDYEANLLRRIAGLIHVPDAESGAARKRVLARRREGG